MAEQVKADSSIEQKVRKSLLFSIIDGSFNAMKVGFGESFFSAFAVFMRSNNIQLGLLSSLPQALGSLSQFLTNKLIRIFGSRKRLVCTGVLLEALMYIPIALVFFFGDLRVFHLIAFVSIYWVFGAIVSPAWNSWIGELVDENGRGSYFGKRNRIIGLVSFLSLLTGGYVLHNYADGTLTQYIGFLSIFTIALISRVGSFIYLSKKYEPEFRIIPEEQFTFIDFIKQARFRNFGSFVFYLCFANFAVYLASPFFAAYMLYDLKMTYLNYTFVTGAAVLARYISMPMWGKASDRFGTKKVMGLSGFMMALNPFLWLFSQNLWYLIIIQLYGGFVWAGFELATFNFVFDSTTPQKRTTCVSYYNILNGSAILIGAVMGGLVVRYNHVFWSKYYLVFILSSVFRYLASLIFIPRLKEVRQVEAISYSHLFLNIISTMPGRNLFYNLMMFKKKKVVPVTGSLKK